MEIMEISTDYNGEDSYLVQKVNKSIGFITH